MGGVRRHLVQKGIHGNPFPHVDFIPGVIIEAAFGVKETRNDPRGNAHRSGQGSKEHAMLIAISGPQLVNSERVWNG
jgi:hypothetical protein